MTEDEVKQSTAAESVNSAKPDEQAPSSEANYVDARRVFELAAVLAREQGIRIMFTQKTNMLIFGIANTRLTASADGKFCFTEIKPS